MPLAGNGPVVLPDIDARPSTEDLASAHALVQVELSPAAPGEIHHSISSAREPRFSDLVSASHARLASTGAQEDSIHLPRYDALEAPSPGDLAGWKATLQQAHVSREYLGSRELNLGLLQTYGKNAWLMGNSQMEDMVRDLESESQARKIELEQVEQARRAVQANAYGELSGLEESWRKGVGRLVEVQAAVEGVKRTILERRRARS